MKYRRNHMTSMQDALAIIDAVDEEFGSAFGRRYGGCVDEYRTENAEILVITIGSPTGAAREAVDHMRSTGCKVGLLKVRVLSPFPARRVSAAVNRVSAFGVVDRSVSFGWNTGPLYQQVIAQLGRSGSVVPSVSFIGGLGGADITTDHMLKAMDIVRTLAVDKVFETPTVWLE